MAGLISLNEFYISSSKVGGYDTAKAFLKAVSDIFYKRTDKVKVYFNSENEAHIVYLIADNNNLKIEVVAIDDNPFKYIGEQFSSLYFVKKSPPLLIINCDVSEFALEICKEFRDIIEQNKESEYEKNWFAFPYAEYYNLFDYFKYRI